MKTLLCDQRSAEWKAAREKCLTTASDMGAWITGTDKRSKSARIARIAAHLSRDVPKDAWQLEQEEQEERRMNYNLPVQRGNTLEPQAREVYAMLTGYEVQQVGMCLSDDELFGASPDGLISRSIPTPYIDFPYLSHGLEIKCPWPDTHVEWLLAGTLPDEHKHQVHGSMAISGLNRWDFLSHCPGHPPLLIEVERDQFTAELEKGLALFRAEYLERQKQLEALKAAFEPTRAKLSAMWASRAAA